MLRGRAAGEEVLCNIRILHPQYQRLRAVALGFLEALFLDAEQMEDPAADHHPLHKNNQLVLARGAMEHREVEKHPTGSGQSRETSR